MKTEVLQSQAEIQRPRNWQISLRSLILATAYLAFMLAWLRWFWPFVGLAIYFPGIYGLCSIAVIFIACFQLRRPSGCQSAWDLLALARFIAIGNLFFGFHEVITVSSATNSDLLAQVIQEGIYLYVFSSITLPLFSTIPCLYVLAFRYRSRPAPITCWIYGILGLAIVDTMLFVILVSTTFGTWGR